MTQHSVRHFGLVIGLKPDCIADYRALHDGSGVRDLLNAANIRNFNIFLTVMRTESPMNSLIINTLDRIMRLTWRG